MFRISLILWQALRYALQNQRLPYTQLSRFVTAFVWINMATFPAYAVFESANHQIESLLKFSRGQNSQISLATRYRYEYVAKDGLANTVNTSPIRLRLRCIANASTARLHFGYLTPAFAGVQAFAEYEGVGDFFREQDYNNTQYGNTDGPLVADPTNSKINRLWISFDGIPNTVLKGGRQQFISLPQG